MASFSTAESNQTQKKAVLSAFQTLGELKDVELWTSMWTITEMVKVMILKLKMDAQKVSEIETDLINESRLHGL